MQQAILDKFEFFPIKCKILRAAENFNAFKEELKKNVTTTIIEIDDQDFGTHRTEGLIRTAELSTPFATTKVVLPGFIYISS